ncbi:Cathepsin K [Sarcoptes scabiei]|uniref:Counting factor associated protein D n=1 Tax=Sarcoptes scabiei TaxID=52283 RepID=A0A834R5S9_SARSC|nr:Cathepsin K [Sarcoptes scabiei]
MEEMKTIFFSHSIAKLVTKEEQTYGMARIIVSVCFLNLLIISFASAERPVFSDVYDIKGRILLPYAELDEPFNAYFDAKANKSRIDYYGELQLTIQRPDTNQFFKIAYMVNKHGHTEQVCFSMDGSLLAPVNIQSVLPDLSSFQFSKRDLCQNFFSRLTAEAQCESWTYSYQFGSRVNKYLFLLRYNSDGIAIPVYYMMMGFDTLLGSHFDKYEIVYESYSTKPINETIFDVADKFECRDFPGETGKQGLALMNPIREFVHNVYDHVDEHFDKFTAKHDPINHLADRTDEEISKIRGRLIRTNSDFNGGLLFNKLDYDIEQIPDQWDWRLIGAVTPVKDQAICGSCWSFGATGTMEGIYFVKTGKLLKLSQQQLVDCSWPEDNNEDYGHYLGVDGICHDSSVKKAVKIKGFYNVTVGDPEAMKAAIYYHGPVSIGVDASQKTFSFYSHGVYYDPKCDPKNLDHQVLAVGYGVLYGQKYWLVKNSWSTYWGNDGYILINQKHNDCGVLSDATFPLIE